MRTIQEINADIAKVEAEHDAVNAIAKRQGKVDAVVNEYGEGYSEAESMSERAFEVYNAKISTLKNELFDATWTLETFEARRAEWNLNVRVWIDNGHNPTYREVGELESRLGFDARDIARAKALHGGQ